VENLVYWYVIISGAWRPDSPTACCFLEQESSTNLTPSVPGNKFVALQLATPRQTYCTLSMPSGLRLEMSALPQPEWLAAFDCAVQSMPELYTIENQFFQGLLQWQISQIWEVSCLDFA
jgi:hypothetical protein